MRPGEGQRQARERRAAPAHGWAAAVRADGGLDRRTDRRRQALCVGGELLDAGTIRPVIDRRYALEDAAEALAYLRQ
jgi:NADPH:quinone reductase-like Zn-dependent oxidoreductase